MLEKLFGELTSFERKALIWQAIFGIPLLCHAALRIYMEGGIALLAIATTIFIYGAGSLYFLSHMLFGKGRP